MAAVEISRADSEQEISGTATGRLIGFPLSLSDIINKLISGHDGIGRRVGFRFLCLGVWVRVPLSAPKRGRPDGRPLFGM